MTYAFNDFMKEEGCDLSRAQAYVDECLQKYHINSSATLDMVECFVFEVVNNFNRYISQMGKEDTSWKEHIKMLPQSETLAEFQDNFAQLLMRVYLKLQEDEKENDICARAKSYIENHYRDVNLSLAELSNVFGLTPSYFSKMYKEKYKVSIPDYINVMRINQAKKLLRDTSQSVQLIAASVGFTESSTFIRIFKKIEGITPGVYRTLEIE
jgi:YesN/AraC family two-component response regulator